MAYHFGVLVQLVSAVRYILGPIQCCLCYLVMWVLLFPFYREEIKSQSRNLSKITLLDSDNVGI